ncbi:MAG: TldD/PmbA family protein [Victivallales bacterium]|nr:TldD/PmbA family protein [Victivallales bacterium]
MATSRMEAMRDRMLAGLATAKKLGADGASLGYSRGESLDCSYESGRLKSARTRETAGYSITALRDGRLGSVSGNRIEDIDLMVERAVSLAAVGSVAHFDAYPAPAAHASVPRASAATRAMPREQFVEAGARIVAELKAIDPEMDISAGGSRSESAGVMVTSGGVVHEGERTSWGLSGGIQRTEGTDMLFAHAWRGWCEPNEFFDPDYIINRVRRDLEWSAEMADAPADGKTQVFLPPEAFSWMLGPVLGGFNGRSVAKGTSPLRDHLGECYFAENLTIEDRPHIPFHPSSAEIDSVGVPTRPCKLVENGVVGMFLYDLDSAGLAGATPTGHAGCSPYHAVVSPGEILSEDLLAGIQDGLYIKSLLGFGQSNIANGDFSGNVALGFRIRGGKIVGRVKNTMISGNLFELLKRDLVLSSDVDPVSLMPSAILNGVNVAGAKG